jgi:transcription-repair coupling factor (superfamily II helicase)
MNQNQEIISWEQLVANIGRRNKPVEIIGLSDAAGAYAAARTYRAHRLPMLVVLDSLKRAERFCQELTVFIKDLAVPVLLFPPYPILPFKLMAYHNETAGRRIHTLYQVMESTSAPVVVTTASALMQRLMPKTELMAFAELLEVGEEIDRDGLVRKLVDGGYSRAAMVEELGDFGLRGGILDIFTPQHSDPLRIEFYGDMVESIRMFAADSQRTIRQLQEVVILPARESIMHRSQLSSVLVRVRTRAAELGLGVTAVREIVQNIKSEGVFPGMESLLADNTLPILVEPSDLLRSVTEIETQAWQGYQSAKERKQLVVEPATLYLQWSQVCDKLANYRPLAFKALDIATFEAGPRAVCRTLIKDTDHVRLALQNAAATEKPYQPLVDWLVRQKEAGVTTLLACRRPSHIRRLADTLEAYGVRAAPIEALSDMLAGQARIYLMVGEIGTGFAWPEAGFAVIGDEEIFGTAYRPLAPVKRSRAVEQLLNIEDLKIGDAVVHTDHGIGLYQGLVKLAVERSVNDYLLLTFRDGDKLYLPVERMSLVQK